MPQREGRRKGEGRLREKEDADDGKDEGRGREMDDEREDRERRKTLEDEDAEMDDEREDCKRWWTLEDENAGCLNRREGREREKGEERGGEGRGGREGSAWVTRSARYPRCRTDYNFIAKGRFHRRPSAPNLGVSFTVAGETYQRHWSPSLPDSSSRRSHGKKHLFFSFHRSRQKTHLLPVTAMAALLRTQPLLEQNPPATARPVASVIAVCLAFVAGTSNSVADDPKQQPNSLPKLAT
ncbi:hypothetical protein ACLOJK_031537 [Asimina triloba]